MDYKGFKIWLISNQNYSKATISNIVSRAKRANNILPWYNDIIYLFMLEREDKYECLSSSVKSQIKKAIKLYFE